MQAWDDWRAPPAWQALTKGLGVPAVPTASFPPDPLNRRVSNAQHERSRSSHDAGNTKDKRQAPSIDRGDDGEFDRGSGTQDACFDLRFLFVSGTGLGAGARTGLGLHSASSDEEGSHRTSWEIERDGGAAHDMCRALARELWDPWPQADIVVHTGSQVLLGCHSGL